MTQPRNIRHADMRRHYIESHPIALVLGIVSLIGGAFSLIVPSALTNTGALAEYLPTWAEYVWLTFYTAGGAGVLAGMWYLSPRMESLGFSVLAGVAFVNIMAVTNIRGFGAVVFGGYSLAIFIGSMVRVVTLVRKKRMTV